MFEHLFMMKRLPPLKEFGSFDIDYLNEFIE